MKVYAVASAALLGLAACGDARERGDIPLTIAVDSSGRYPVIRSVGTGPRWRTTLIATVGSAEGGPSEFGRVRSVLLRSDGSLFVVDPGYSRLAVFDSTGAFHAQWGRKGAGPGEYSSPYSIAWLGDSLALLDPSNSRLGVYDPNGAWLRSWLVQRITGGQTVRLYREPPAAFWAYATRPGPRGLDGLFVRYTSDGPTDTLLSIRPPAELGGNAMCETPDKGLSFFNAPYGAAWHLLPAPGLERALNVSTRYRIIFLGASGDTARVVEREVEPAPISDAEWEAALVEWRAFHAKWPTAKCDRDDFQRPNGKPVIESMFFDDLSRLWVEVLSVSGRSYEVFDRNGRLVATIAGLPASGGIDPSVVANRIALVVPDSNGVPFVQVHRIGDARP